MVFKNKLNSSQRLYHENTFPAKTLRATMFGRKDICPNRHWSLSHHGCETNEPRWERRVFCGMRQSRVITKCLSCYNTNYRSYPQDVM